MLHIDNSQAGPWRPAKQDVAYALYDCLGPAAIDRKRRGEAGVMMFPPVKRPSDGVPLIDNMFAPEILSGGVAGLAVMNGIVTITLENPRCDHSHPQPVLERVVVGRLALPIPAAQALLSGLYQFLSQHGLNPLTARDEASCQ